MLEVSLSLFNVLQLVIKLPQSKIAFITSFKITMFRLPLSRYITMLTGTRINTTLLPKALRYPSNVKSASTTTNTEISEVCFLF